MRVAQHPTPEPPRTRLMKIQRWQLAVVVAAAVLLVVVPTAILLGPFAPPPQADLILHGGVVVTMEGSVKEAVAVKGDRIVAVGSDTEILSMRGPGVRLVDLDGRTLLPGFIDSHAHWIGDRSAAGRDTAEEAIQAALEAGWTSVSELFVNQDRLNELQGLDATGRLRLRVNAYLPVSWQDERFGTWYEAYEPGREYSPMLRIAGIKAFMDNGPGIGYENRTYWFTEEELSAVLATAHAAGFQVAVHGIVDTAIDTILDAFENALGDQPGAHRPRLEHAVMLRDDQLVRMRALGVVASVQLSWFTADWTEEILRDPGPQWAHLVGRWRDLLDSGVHVIGGTDHPWTLPPTTVGPAMKAVYDAVTRVAEDGRSPPSWMSEQRITVDEALRLLTIDAAYGTFQEDEKGSIVPGKLADLVVLSENPLTVPGSALKDIEVVMTMVGGRAEHCAVEYAGWCSSPASTSGPVVTSPSSICTSAAAVGRHPPIVVRVSWSHLA